LPTAPEHRIRNLAVVGLLSGIIAFVAVVQLRSQAEVQASLAGQDNTALAFLIDDLHRAHDTLEGQAASLAHQAQSLKAGGHNAAMVALSAQQQQLQIVDGLVAVSGPGVVLNVTAPLTAVDLQDALNNLRLANAEAIMVDQRRVVAESVIEDSNGQVLVDGAVVGDPWTFTVIGDPTQLGTAAGLMARSLDSDPRVKSVSFRSNPNLTIGAVIRAHPFVYGRS